MNGIKMNYPIYNYYDDNTTHIINNRHQEDNSHTNRFAPLFDNEQNCESFKEDINSNDLISNLYGEGSISEDEYYLLSADNIKNIRLKQSSLLIDILNNKLLNLTEEKALNLVKLISNTVKCKQPFLIYTLNTDKKLFSQAKQLALNTLINSQTIINNIEHMTVETIEPLFSTQGDYEDFKNDIDIVTLISSLYSNNIISAEENEKLTQYIAKPQKVNILIEILNTKLNDPKVNKQEIIEQIKKSLKDDCNQYFLLNTINSTH